MVFGQGDRNCFSGIMKRPITFFFPLASPLGVDYKSIRLVDLGTIAQLSKVQRDVESLKPKSEQHITFNELLTLEKKGNLDAKCLVNEIDAAYQYPNKDLKSGSVWAQFSSCCFKVIIESLPNTARTKSTCSSAVYSKVVYKAVRLVGRPSW